MQLLKGLGNGSLRSLTFTGDGQYLVCCGGGGKSICLWRLATGKRSFLSWHGYRVERVVAPGRGSRLASEDGIQIAVWSLAGGIPDQPEFTRGVLGPPRSTFNADGTVLAHIAYLPGGSTFLQFDGPVGATTVPPIAIPRPANSAVFATAWSPDGRTFAISLAGLHHEGDLYLISFDNVGAMTGPIPLGGTGWHLVFSPDSQSLAVHTDSRLSLHDPATGKMRGEPVQEGAWIRGLAFLPGGRLLTAETVNGAGHTRTWDVASGQLLDDRDWDLGPLTVLAVAGDGMRAAVGNERGQILVFDLD
jgi:WD40 repeat protein